MGLSYNNIHSKINDLRELHNNLAGSVESARKDMIVFIVKNVFLTIALGLICFGILYLKRKYL